MYAFEGNYRRTPQQNLAGASRLQGKNELISRAHSERQKRQELRAREDGAVKIQAIVRGFLTRRRFKTLFSNQFDSLIKDLRSANYFSLNDIIYVIRRIPFLGVKNPDVPRILIATSIILDHKNLIVDELQKSLFDWTWRLKMMMKYNLMVLKLSKNCKYEFYINSLRYVDCFTSFEYISQRVNDEIAKEFISKMFQYSVFKEYFTVGFLLLEKTHGTTESGMDPSYPVQMIIRPFISFNHITSFSYKSMILQKFCSTLNSMENEIHPSIFERLLPEMKSINFPFIDYLKAMMELDETQYKSILLYCALYFDDNKTVFEQHEEKIYFKLLALLTKNLFSISNSSSAEVDSDNDSEVEDDDDRFTEQKILKDCAILLNDPRKADMWVDYLDAILRNEHWDVLMDFTSCLYHLLICGNNPVYQHRIFLLLTYHNHCLKGFWQCISQLKREVTFSFPVPLLSILASGMNLDKKEATQLLPLLTMFSYLLKFCYSTMTDDEFYSEEPNPSSPKPFTLSEVISLSKTLKDVAVGIIMLAYPDHHDAEAEHRIQISVPTANVDYNIRCWTLLMQEVIGLVSLLNARDSRKPFTKEGHWLSNFISIPDNVGVYDSKKAIIPKPFTFTRNHSRIITPQNADGCEVLSARDSRNFCLLTSVPFTIAFLKRFSILQNHFDLDRFEHQNPQVHFLQSPHYFVKIRRHYLYEDAFEKLSRKNAPNLKQTVKIQMVNKWGLDEAGVDGGGVFREFITELLKTAFDPNRGFFICNANNELYPNPNVHVVCPDFFNHYYFIGRMLGKAIYEGIMAEIPLADFFLAKLTGDTTNMYLNNLASLDPQLYKNIMNLRTYKGDFAELGLDFTNFTNEYGRTISKELKPNGAEISVTAENVTEYIDLIAKFKMHEEIVKQTEVFKIGLQEVFSLDWLQMFSPKELQIIISGDEAPIDISDMKQNTVYGGGYSAEHPCIVMFWNILESFSNNERSGLLKFITSCSRPPLLGFKEFQPPLCIQLVEGIDDRFPTSSTCMNLLKLPAFSDETTMRTKLLYAIQSGAGFELS